MIFEIIRANRKKIIIISSISAMSGMANILLLKLAMTYAEQIDNLLTSILYYWWALFFLVILGFLSQFLLALLSAKITYEVREKLTNSISNFTYEQIEALGPERLYTTLTDDIAVINNWLSVIPLLVYNGTIVLLCLIYMGTMSIELFATVIFFLVSGILVSKLFIIKHGVNQFGKRREIQDTLFESYRSAIEGFKELNFNRRRRKQFHGNELVSVSGDFRDTTSKAAFYFTLANSWNAGMLFLAVGSVLLFSHFFNEFNDTLISFIVVVFYVMGPIIFLMNAWQNFSQASVAIKRLKKLKFDSNVIKPAKIEFSKFQYLELKDISYKYINDDVSETFEFGPFDLKIERGDIIFFVGGNGSGKTTAAKILTGLYKPTEGEIRLNDILLSRDKIDWYNRYFSTIFSDYHLFDRIVNKHGEHIDDKIIFDFLGKMNLSDKVIVEDGRLSTTDLSEGQRKRLALLVSYFEDSEILVFDEWAAEQDPHFREYFYEDLLAKLKAEEKTVIVITHDDRYFHVADKVIKFERGKVVDSVEVANHV